MTARVFCLTVIMAAFLIPRWGYAELTHTYTGTPFVEFVGTPFTTDDFVTGFVKFLMEPVPDSLLGQEDVEFFRFSAGPLTIDSDNGVMFQGSFAFDAQGQIVEWNLGVVTILDEIDIGSSAIPEYGFDLAIIGTDYATSGKAGTWEPVPEPSMMVLWSLAGVFGVCVALGRSRGVSATFSG